MQRQHRFYIDTSVFGGVLDSAFDKVSQRLFDEIVEDSNIILLSDITLGELRDAYLAAKVVGPRWSDDAAHVATATVARADLIVSWNFRHLVKWEKIRKFNAVNLAMGYPVMTILSPREVIRDDEEL